MNIYALMALVNVATSVVLGILVILADRKARTNRLFTAFAASVAFWSYSYFAWQIATDPSTALFWTHMLMAGAVFITPVYLHFVALFLGEVKKQIPVIIGGYIFIAVFSFVNWSPHFINGVEPRLGFAFWPIAGPLFSPFLICWIFLAIYPIFLLWRRLLKRDELAPAIRYIIAGTVIGYVGGCTNYFLWYGVPVLPFGNISASVYLALVAYAIMRHKLFNMKVIAADLLVFSLWLFEFIRLFLADNQKDQLVDGVLLTVMLVVGVLLIRSIEREVEQKEQIEKLSEQKSEFMSFASHEIRNPITAMRGYASLIVDGTAGDASPEVRGVARKILVEGSEVLNMISEYLNKSKVELGQISFAKDTYDLGAAVSAIVDGYKPHAEEKGILLKKRVDLSQPLNVVGDEGKTKEVVGNLIDNAVKYTGKGEIVVSVEKINGKIRAEIADTGGGISPQTMPQLFKKFSRADAKKMNLHGTGLGLYLAKTFIEAQGGKIWAESEGEGKGSTFIIEFPAI